MTGPVVRCPPTSKPIGNERLQLMEKRLTKSEAKCRKLEAELSKKPSWPKDLKGAMDELGIGSRTTMTAVRNDLDDRFGIWTNEKSVSRYTDVDRDRQIDVQSRLPTRGGARGRIVK